MTMIKLNIIIFIFVTQQLLSTLQYEEIQEGIFEQVDIPKYDIITLLNRKIFRGRRVSVTEHPYVVSIRRHYSHYLTGSVISRTVIITVAHPIYEVNPSELAVVAGENYSDRGTALLTVVLVLIHELFDPYSLAADIALLKLYEDVIYKVAAKPVALMLPHVALNGRTGFVTGWGRCDRTGKELCLPRSSEYFRGEWLDPMLRTVKFTLQTGNPHCEAYVTPERKLDEGMLCIGEARDTDPMCQCMAVPGAPLVVNARLTGIQSWGFGCGYTRDLPLIYTDIRHYHHWLVHNIPILKVISKKNFSELFQATKVQLLSQWHVKTRMKLPKIRKIPPLDVQALDVDMILSKLKGKAYDVRDFLSEGSFHQQKVAMYLEISRNDQKGGKEKIKKENCATCQPFLSEEVAIAAGLLIKNGSLYDVGDDDESDVDLDVEFESS